MERLDNECQCEALEQLIQQVKVQAEEGLDMHDVIMKAANAYTLRTTISTVEVNEATNSQIPSRVVKKFQADTLRYCKLYIIRSPIRMLYGKENPGRSMPM
ncbi:hypothetical protein Q3G72_022278 [Acer saccharum]|nr:hypothetical protein Q3G72_022278 [Acer saccharum]